jgi:hypothetical protein
MPLQPEVMTRLRDVLKRRKIKVTWAAERLGMPYRRLQNYLYGQSDMPVDVLFGLADLAGVSVDYLRKDKHVLDNSALQSALVRVLGATMPLVEMTSGGLTVRPCPHGTTVDTRSTGLLAFMIADRYDLALEASLLEPVATA